MPNIMPRRRTGPLRWRIRAALSFAIESIWSARQRMWLVVLGVAIGFGAIDSMMIIGSSVQARLKASMDSLGGDVLTLNISSPESVSRLASPRQKPPIKKPVPSREHLDPSSLVQLLRSLPEVDATAWAWQGNGCMGDSESSVLLSETKISLSLQNLLGFNLFEGRFLLPGDLRENNILLGATLFHNLHSQRPDLGVGSILQFCGKHHRVVGILRPHLGSDLVQALNINDSVFTAGPDALTKFSETGESLLIRLRNGTPAETYSQTLLNRLNHLMPSQNIQASGAWEIMRLRQEQVALYANFLAVLGVVSLLVGTLGIANLMLVSVTERQSEIGLRMAIGAKRSDIVAQFISEGVLICLLGAAVGLLLGWAVAAIALEAGGFTAKISVNVFASAGALALVCGVASGAYPAYRAASVDPARSLQS